MIWAQYILSLVMIGLDKKQKSHLTIRCPPSHGPKKFLVNLLSREESNYFRDYKYVRLLLPLWCNNLCLVVFNDDTIFTSFYVFCFGYCTFDFSKYVNVTVSFSQVISFKPISSSSCRRSFLWMMCMFFLSLSSLQNICEAKVHLHKVMTLCVTSWMTFTETVILGLWCETHEP